MAGARKPDSAQGMMSVLDRLGKMVEVAQQASDETLGVMRSVDAQLRNAVTTQLRKQTQILESIRGALSAMTSREVVEELRRQSASQVAAAEAKMASDRRAEAAFGSLASGVAELSARVAEQGTSAWGMLSSVDVRLERMERTGELVVSKLDAVVQALQRLRAAESDQQQKGRKGEPAADKILRSIDARLERASRPSQKETATERLLRSIDTRLAKAASPKADAKEARSAAVDAERFSKAFGELGRGVDALVKAASKVSRRGAELKSFFSTVADSVTEFVSKVDAAKVKSFLSVLSSLTKGAVLYSAALAAATPLLMIGVAGAKAFALSVRTLLDGVDTRFTARRLAGMDAVLAIGRGSFLFGASLAGFALISPLAFIGAKAFAATVGVVDGAVRSLGNSKEQADSMHSLLGLAGGIAKFALSMSAVAVLFPLVLVGAGTFALSVKAVLHALSPVADSKSQYESVRTLLGLSKGIALFALSMAATGVLFPLVLVGAGTFALSVKVVAMALAPMADSRSQYEGVKTLLGMARGIALFAVSMAVTGALFPVVLAGALTFALSVAVVGLALRAIDSETAQTGVRTMFWAGFAVAALGLGLRAFSELVTPADALGVAISVGLVGAAFWLIGKMGEDITQGAIAMVFASVSMLAVGLGLAAFKALGVTPVDGIAAAITVGAVALPFLLAGIGPIPQAIARGSVALMLAGLSLAAISAGLLVFKAAHFTVDDGLMLGGVLLGLGTVMAIAGIPPVALAIGLGSFVMALAGASLMVVSLGLAAIKAVNFTEEDGDRLKVALGSLATGFLGGEAPGGIVGAIKYAAGIAARSALLLVAVPPMLVASAALVVISAGLAAFKATQFDESDGERLERTIASLAGSMSILTDKKRQAELGIDISPWSMMKSVAALSGLGNVVFSLARGVSSMANLEVLEHEVKDGKLVLKSSRKLTESDFSAASDNIARIITTLTRPIAEVGMIEKAGSSGNPLFDLIFSNGYISTGIDVLGGLGGVIASIGQGVRDFANLELVEHEVRDGKLVPKRVVRMTDTDFVTASANVARVMSFMAKELYEIGRMEGESDGWFSEGYVTNGIEAVTGLGGTIASLAQGIKDFANLEIVEHEVKNGKLVPKRVVRMGPADFTAASANIGSVVGFLAGEFYKIGQMEDEDDGWFSEGYVTNGIDAISGLGTNLVELAKGVAAMARMEFVEHEVKMVDGRPQLVPKTVHVLGRAEMAAAAGNMGGILGFFAEQFAAIGKMEDESSGWFSGGYVEKGRAAIAGIGGDIAAIADAIVKIAGAEFTTHEVRDGKLVPVSTRKMAPSDYAAAAAAIGSVLGLFAGELAKIGKMDEAGIFSTGYVAKGREAIAGMGKDISSIVDAIVKMSSSEFTTYEARDGKLVPVSTRKLGSAEIEGAAAAIRTVLGLLSQELAKIGKDDEAGLFSTGYVAKGREAIAGMGQDIASVVDAVVKMASAEFTTYEVRDGKLVPVATRKLSPTDVGTALGMIRAVMSTFASGFADAGAIVSSKEGDIKVASAYFPKINELINGSADTLTKWAQVPDPQASVMSIGTFLNTTASLFDQTKDKELPMKLGFFQVFAKNMETLATSGPGLETAANNVERISASVKGMKDAVNAMDLKKLTLTNAMMASIAALSKSPEKTGQVIERAIKEGFKEFAEAFKDAIGGVERAVQVPSAPIVVNAGPAQAAPVQMQQQGMGAAAQAAMMSQMSDAIGNEIREALTSTVLRVKVENQIG